MKNEELETRYVIEVTTTGDWGEGMETVKTYYSSANSLITQNLQMATRYRTEEAAQKDKEYIDYCVAGEVAIIPVLHNESNWRISLLTTQTA